MQAIIGIDPGREKCGFAILALDGCVLKREVLKTGTLPEKVMHTLQDYEIGCIVMGNGTTSAKAVELARSCAPDCEVRLVDEYRTTEMARKRYFKENPPQGLKKFVPAGMLYPPVPVDDYVAVILAERYLQENRQI